MSDGRRLPIEDEASAPFWAGAREGRLLMPRLANGTLQWPPRPAALAPAAEWVELSGRGTVWSYSVVHRSSHPAPAVPYVMAVIELDEGAFMFANVVGGEPTEVGIGMAVAVDFEALPDDARLPVFRLVDA